MSYDIRQMRAAHQLRLARQRLHECEEAFKEHLSGDPLTWIDKIAAAERDVTSARARAQAAGVLPLPASPAGEFRTADRPWPSA